MRTLGFCVLPVLAVFVLAGGTPQHGRRAP
jgi:hypothetical protein